MFLSTVPLGLVLGGAWTFLTVAALALCLCGLDAAFGFDSEAPGANQSWEYRILPWLCVLAQIGLTIFVAVAVADQRTTLFEAIGETVSVGLSGGTFGILAAHELVHRQTRGERALGLAMLAVVGYMHFRIAHIHGHHVRAATLQDPATARRGESVYRFLARSVTGQVEEAWAFEAERLRRRGEPVIGSSNRMLKYAVIELCVGAGVALFSRRALGFWLAQAVLAVILLELFNYIAHYGMMRRQRGDILERMELRHSWNCSRRVSNWSLFNMGRHSDHHRHGSRAYQGLEPVDDTPELPMGYAGSILLALAPPLWRKVMDPRLDRWVENGGRSKPAPNAAASGQALCSRDGGPRPQPEIASFEDAAP